MTQTPTRAAFIDNIRRLPDEIARLVQGLSPEELTTAHLASEWSIAQNVHHLADSHTHSYIRCKLILTQDYPTLTPYNQDVWAGLADSSSAEIGSSLIWLRGLHNRWCEFWENLAESDWERKGFHPEYGDITLESLLQAYSRHGQAHIDQITRTKQAIAR